MPPYKTVIGLLIACAIGILIGGGATYVVINNRGIHIQSFSADKQQVLIGDKVTFTWETTGATEVAFRFVHLPTGSDGDLWEYVYDEVSAGNLPPNSQWSYEVPIDLSATRFKFEIEASDQAGNKVAARSGEIQVTYRPCFDNTPDCANSPIQTRVTFQAFEHGYMLLREDTQTIYAMTRDLTADVPHTLVGWQAFADTWSEPDQYALDGQPPNGLLQPLPRFVKVIASNGLQTDLGWATTPETKFDSIIQQTRTVCSGAVGCTPMLLIQLDQGRVLHLAASDTVLEQGHGWQVIS